MLGDLPILLFARAPERGRVKTRLSQIVGEDEALRTHVELLGRALEECTRASRRVELWVAGSTRAPQLLDLIARHAVSVREQQDADLGTRMYTALRFHLQRGTPALLVGCDIPEMTAAHLLEAIAALEAGSDAVLGPSEDGGYWAIGLSRDVAALFADIPWGTALVCERTRQRAALSGVRITEVATLWDVDTVDDWRRWRALKRV